MYDERKVIEKFTGATITKISLEPRAKDGDRFDTHDELVIEFKHPVGKVRIFDDGQNCCERRYMTTDGDDLSYYVGAHLVALRTTHAEAKVGEYGDVDDLAFLNVDTSKGTFVVSFHNDHNGYYGGFGLTVVEA